MKNYTPLHMHTDMSLLDSCTNYKEMIERAVGLGFSALCFTEHGTIAQWIDKKNYCEKYNIKYLHGIEIYLTETIFPKVRDNYHTVLIAKNYDGVREINSLIELASREDHKYYKDRITFDEFLEITDNVIKISACLKSPLKCISDDNQYYERLAMHYDYYEIQPHIMAKDIQANYNKKLYEMSLKYNKPLVATNDIHYTTKYGGECRTILQTAKGIEFDDEDSFDLCMKSYTDFCNAFASQGALSEDVIMEAINNTNVIANSVEAFELDTSPKYLKLYEDDEKVYKERIRAMILDKASRGIVELNDTYLSRLKEEMKALSKLNMMGFMLFMSELLGWCWENNIPTGPCRGSVGGSLVAYITDITDVNPIKWDTIFSRFANEDRVELGDIDVDFSPDQRDLVYDYIINRVGEENTAFISTVGTAAGRRAIDEIGRALHRIWMKNNPKDSELNSPYTLPKLEKVKSEFDADPDTTRTKYKDIFYYYDGISGAAISRGIHPAGIVASSTPLSADYGVYWQDGKRVLSINMDEVHEVSLIKYDILSLNNIQIIRDTCAMANIPYPKSHEIDWEDERVWNDLLISPAGIFQFSGEYAFDCLKRFNPRKINDMSLVNAALRPSGATYREDLLSGYFHHNPSAVIDELLKDNKGYLVFQEDTIKFLQDICGLTGSEADNIRRAIGRKQKDRLDAAMPKILEGYCQKSDSPRNVAEEEAKTFLRIIEDSANYQFGYNHSVGYSMIGYLCAYYRYHYPIEFITSYLNNVDKMDDIKTGIELAKLKKVTIEDIQFGSSIDKYTFDKSTNTIYKGIASIKFCNAKIALELKEVADTTNIDNFVELVDYITKNTSVNTKQLNILIILGFFKKFGENKYLMDIVEVYNNLSNRNQISKDKLESLGLTKELITRYSAKETEKLYKEINIIGLINEIIRNIPNKPLPIQLQMEYEMKYLEYIVYKNPDVDYGYYFVSEFKTYKNKNMPYLTLYRIKDGIQFKTKIAKSFVFEQNRFKLYSVLGNVQLNQVPKRKFVNGKFELTNEKELVLSDYVVLV